MNMDSESSLDDKFSTLSVEEELSPDIVQLSQHPTCHQKAGGKCVGADLVGEELHNCELGGAMPCGKAPSEREEKNSKAAWDVNEQKTEEGQAALCMEPADGPPDGFFLIFPYVDLKALFTLERVSKPMRSGVNDVLVWTKLHVRRPLSRNLSNDNLVSLVQRAKGNLKCLRLVDCFTISDATLGHVLSLSPRLEKLHIPGCIGLSAEGIVCMVEQHAKENRAKGLSGIKQLRVRGIYMTQQHLNALRAVVLSGRGDQAVHVKPLYWHNEPTSIVEDERAIDVHMGQEHERAIDVDMCPRCGSDYPVVVYDCTKESCQHRGKLDPSKACRGCVICITRCVACGSCHPGDDDWEKTCCADVLCSTCWLHVPKCSECNRPFCRKHKSEFYVRYQGGPRICEDCKYSDSEDVFELEDFLDD